MWCGLDFGWNMWNEMFQKSRCGCWCPGGCSSGALWGRAMTWVGICWNTNIPPCETENHHLQTKPLFNTMLVTDKGFFLNMMIFLFSGHCIHSLEGIVVNNFVCNTHTLWMGKLPRPKSGGMSYYLSRPHCAMLILMRKMRFRAVEHSSNKKHL